MSKITAAVFACFAIAMCNTDCGGGGSGGGGGSSTTSSSYEPSPEMKALLDKVEQARKGVAVDFNGDGVAEFQRTVADDGTVTVEVTDPDENLIYISTTHPNGDTELAYDSNGDGYADIEIHGTYEANREVRLEDRDGDHYPEWRTTLDFDVAAGQVHGTVEYDENGSGEYAVVETFTEPMVQSVGEPPIPSPLDPCLNDVRPASGYPMLGPGGAQISTSFDPLNSDGNCTADQAAKLANALDCAFNRAATCLYDVNRRLSENVMKFLVKGEAFDISCGIPAGCSDIAFTYPCAPNRKCIAPDTRQRINFNPDFIASDGDIELCDDVLHEVLHLAGERAGPNHDDGVDAVYSCARYCAGCSHSGKGAPENSSVDCDRCADNVDRKKACGYKEELKDGDCDSSTPPGVCHSGLACISGPCLACESIVTKSCDGSDLGESKFGCCLACPVDCDQAIDFYCARQPAPYLANTCSNPPPFCR
ncbi:MAG: hypothetical protein FWD73_06070 [Polyangiaceae bacterium]|nr:hypothetical protein [Polyangiaceae bacterium]